MKLRVQHHVETDDEERVFPTMEELWESAKEVEDQFDELLEKVGYDRDEDGKDIEALLSRCHLFLTHSDDQTLQGFVDAVEEEIVTSCRFPGEPPSLPVHEVFLRKIARRKSKLPRPKIFTTNYDRCFEEASARTQTRLIDGFSFNIPPVFDGTNFDIDFVHRGDDRELGRLVPDVFHLYKVHGSVDWERDGEAVRKAGKPENPLLIYPRFTKFESSYRQPFLEMISRFQIELRREEVSIIVVGFGFRDKHLVQPLLSAVDQNPGLNLLVVSPSLSTKDEDWAEKLSTLAEKGDQRITLLEATFEDLTSAMPDLVAARERELRALATGGD